MTPPKDRKPHKNMRQVTNPRVKPRPPRKPPPAIADDAVAVALAALAEHDETPHHRRARLRATIIDTFKCDPDTLRYKLTRAGRVTAREIESEAGVKAAGEQLAAMKEAAAVAQKGGRPAKVAIVVGRARGGRQPNATLGAAQSAIKRGRPPNAE